MSAVNLVKESKKLLGSGLGAVRWGRDQPPFARLLRMSDRSLNFTALQSLESRPIPPQYQRRFVNLNNLPNCCNHQFHVEIMASCQPGVSRAAPPSYRFNAWSLLLPVSPKNSA